MSNQTITISVVLSGATAPSIDSTTGALTSQLSSTGPVDLTVNGTSVASSQTATVRNPTQGDTVKWQVTNNGTWALTANIKTLLVGQKAGAGDTLSVKDFLTPVTSSESWTPLGMAIPLPTMVLGSAYVLAGHASAQKSVTLSQTPPANIDQKYIFQIFLNTLIGTDQVKWYIDPELDICG